MFEEAVVQTVFHASGRFTVKRQGKKVLLELLLDHGHPFVESNGRPDLNKFEEVVSPRKGDIIVFKLDGGVNRWGFKRNLDSILEEISDPVK